jgi:acyl-CoA synthetase (AMP-forming)/AMP-acid ligase II
MIDQHISYQAACRPLARAVLRPQGVITFGQFNSHITNVAAELGNCVSPGQVVAVSVGDPYLRWVAVLALSRCGVASAASTDEDADLRLVDPEAASPNAIPLSPDWLSRQAPTSMRRVVVDPEGLGRVSVSSGTTGQRKRIGTSWRLLDATLRNTVLVYRAPTGWWWPTTGIDTGMGFNAAMAAWATGNSVGLGLPLRPDLVMKGRPALISLVTSQLWRLVRNMNGAKVDWPLRLICGGGIISPELARQTRLTLTADLNSVYGTSETGAVAVGNLSLFEGEENAVGYILPNVDVEARDEEGCVLPAGSAGRLWIRGERVIAGYLSGASSSSSIFENGWFSPGDIGRVREDGLLYMDGRVDELMNLGGHKVSPSWVERPALQCVGVRDAAAFTAQDSDGATICCLAIETEESFRLDDLEAILRPLMSKLGPLRIVSLRELPRNEMGKVERARLTDFLQSS